MGSRDRERGQFVSSEIYPAGAEVDLRKGVTLSEEETQELTAVELLLAPGLLIREEDGDEAEDDVPFSFGPLEDEFEDLNN